MSGLARLLDTTSAQLVEEWERRVRVRTAPSATTEPELRDHMPAFLRALVKLLGGTGTEAATDTAAREHGRQRYRVGFDIDMLVGEYAILRDVIFDVIATNEVELTLSETRHLTSALADAVAEAVAEYTIQRAEGAQAQAAATQALLEREQAARAEAQAEREKQHALFMQAPVAIAILDGQDHVFTFANPAYRALINGRDVIGKALHDALPDIKDQGFDRLLKQVMATGETFFGKEVAIKLEHHAEGELLFLNFVYTPKRNGAGEIDGVLMSGSDVTDQVRARQRVEALVAQLAESEERVRRVVETSGTGTWEVDFTTHRTTADAQFRALLGLDPEAPLTIASVIAELPADERERVAAIAARAISGVDGGGYFVEHRAIVPGSAVERWVEGRGQVIFDDQGKATRFVGTLVDISERKRAEVERKVIEAELRAADLRKDEFLTTASHELRTPLNAILGWAQLLRSGELGFDTARKAAETIERNAKAQVRIIEDILDGSRIINGKLRLEIRPLNMTTLVRAAVDAVRPAADAKQITVHLALDPAAARIIGDPDRLQQVVWNLASNAIKFTPKGGTVEVHLDRVGTSVELSVKDTGEGIAPEFLPHVFERFRQADSTTTRRHGGLGLGLALVRHLVDAHGGGVRADSDGAGLGATFTVTLPVQAVFSDEVEALPRTHSASVQRGPETRLEGITTLVVDDEADARDLISAVLRMSGATVLAAANAEDALRLLAEVRPQILISDIGMPGIDGYALLRRVRDHSVSELAAIPAIALTAYARQEDRRLALDAGFQAHVAKPVEPGDLVRAVAELAQGGHGTP